MLVPEEGEYLGVTIEAVQVLKWGLRLRNLNRNELRFLEGLVMRSHINWNSSYFIRVFNSVPAVCAAHFISLFKINGKID